eukprot:TRINITY_DN2249_c0_g1_i1.p1 TRINITY_DN2249_c0_g1~~TRINITY_DN2249_c0_g1_i1.p1  ORF type:complete len:386 (-),score=88.98 TRINITY_DN2249_c0_g1_i1:100-1257(-)
MSRRPPRSTLSSSSAASDVYKRQVGALTGALKAQGMWDNTLMVFLSDNGGPVYEPGAASNYPHRGGKYSDFEGGVRTNAFLSGGVVPVERRGSSFEGVISIADWYATFCGLAGVSPEDHAALDANTWLAQHNLPTLFPIDSVDQWPAILNNSNARTGPIALSNETVLEWPYKLVTGVQPYSMYLGPLYPNCSTVSHLGQDGPVFTDLKIFDQRINYSADPTVQTRVTYSHDCAAGCLFDVSADPSEREDLAADPTHQATLNRLQAELAQVKLFLPDRGSMAAAACQAGVHNGGFYGPFVDIEGYYTDVSAPSVEQKAKNLLYLALVKKYNSSEVQDKCVTKFTNFYQRNSSHSFFSHIDKCTNTSATLGSVVPLNVEGSLICDLL